VLERRAPPLQRDTPRTNLFDGGWATPASVANDGRLIRRGAWGVILGAVVGYMFWTVLKRLSPGSPVAPTPNASVCGQVYTLRIRCRFRKLGGVASSLQFVSGRLEA